MKIITRKFAKQSGIKRYFTGMPCKYGHIAERFCASGRCSECDRIIQSSKEYREKRREYEQSQEMRTKRSVYNKTLARKKSLSELQKKSYAANKPAFLMRFLVSRFPSMIRKQMNGCSSCEKLGYSLSEFKVHIESLFKDGMSWDNHGEWHIDHIIPVSKFPIENISQVNALNNLQPLWAIDNLKKGNRIV